jgi:hypothetical protein
MATDKNTLKNWFKTGLKPTQAQFWAWMDSYWHKDETIPTNKIDGLESALNGKASTQALDNKVDKVPGKSLLSDTEIERLLTLENQDLSLKADLVDGQVPASQLPSYVDDVLNGQFIDSITFINVPTGLPYTLEEGKIYVDIITNITYRWSGTVLIPIGSTLTLGETESTAYRGDRGKIAYDKAVELINSGIEFISNALLKLRIIWFTGFTIAQRNAIASPQEGMIIYINENPKGFQVYEDGVWRRVGANISNADLNFAANRIHNLGSNKLTFTNGRVEVPTLEMPVTTANSIVNKIWNEGLKLWFTNNLGVNKSVLLDGDIVDATATQRGLVSTIAQIFSGNKTFRGHVRIESPVSTDDPDALIIVNSVNDILLKVNSSRLVTMGNFAFSSVTNTITFSGTKIFERSGISTLYGDAASAIIGFRTTNLNFTMRDGKARLGGTVGASTDSTALLELQSTTGGFLLPRMTQAQRLALVYLGGAPPAIGLQVYQTDGVEGVYIHKSTGWQFAY